MLCILRKVEFDPEREGLLRQGEVYLKIGDRFFELELKLRMLEPHELALAQGFRNGYRFVRHQDSRCKTNRQRRAAQACQSYCGSSDNAKSRCCGNHFALGGGPKTTVVNEPKDAGDKKL